MLILISTLLLASNIQPVESEPATIFVPDDYEKIQWAIGNATDGDTIFVRAGTYYEHVIINKSLSLIGESTASTEIRGNEWNNPAVEIDADNVKIENFTIRLPKCMWGVGSGISVGGQFNVTIQNNNIRNMHAYGTGISLSGSSNNTISRNNVSARYAIKLHQSSQNEFELNNILGQRAFAMWYSSDNRLRNNRIDGEYGFGVMGEALKDFINHVDESNTVNSRPIYYWINRTDAIIPTNPGYVALVNCSNIAVENLSLRHNIQGVALAYTKNSRVVGNTIKNHVYGVYSIHSTNNIISENLINNIIEEYGITLINSSSNVISKNSISNIWNFYGIGLSNSSNNVVFGNLITNAENGIEIRFSSGNIIFANDIRDSLLTGIVFWNSSNNSIYHNNFIDNNEQVNSYISENVWDDGYPSGGNYWSDYTDVDEKSGPIQDILGSDDIWDHPYAINPSNRDNYPLVEPLPRTIGELKMKIEKYGSNGEIDNKGIVKSFYAKLNVAEKLVDKGKTDEAKTILEEDFIPQIQNLSGIHITVETADLLIESAEYVASHL